MNFNIRALKDSLYSKDFYREAAERRTGSGFSFLALLALIQSLVYVLAIAVFMLGLSSNWINDVIEQTPEVTVKNGELSIDKPSPYHIKADERTIIVIDTVNYNNKSADQIFGEMKKNDWYALATKTKIFTSKEEHTKYEVHDLSKDSTKDMKFNKDDVHKWAKIFSILALPIGAVVIFLFLWLYKIVQMLIYSLIGLLFRSILDRKLEYSAIQRLVSYALWPAMLIGIFLGFIGLAFWPFFSIAITTGYIYFALKSVD